MTIVDDSSVMVSGVPIRAPPHAHGIDPRGRRESVAAERILPNTPTGSKCSSCTAGFADGKAKQLSNLIGPFG